MLPWNWVCCLHESEFSSHENCESITSFPGSLTFPRLERERRARRLETLKTRLENVEPSSTGNVNESHSWLADEACRAWGTLKVIHENWAARFLLTMKSSLLTVHLKNLTTKQRKNSLAYSFDVAFLANVFRVVEKPCDRVNAEKKLFNPAQVALTKILRNEAKIYQKTDFLSSEGHLLSSPGCCLTLASSLDVVQVIFRFAAQNWCVYRVLLGNDLGLISKAAVSVLLREGSRTVSFMITKEIFWFDRYVHRSNRKRTKLM